MKKNVFLPQGFTLIELLVVISIITLLASVILLAVSSARQKSRDSRRLTDVRQVGTAMELYLNDYKTYPTAGAGGVVLNALQSGPTGGPPLTPTYLPNIPLAPTPADGSCATTGYYSNQYWFVANGQGNASVATFAITFCLGGPAGKLLGGTHTLTNSGFQ